MEVQLLASAGVTAQVGRRVGPFRLIRMLGEGGMGAVYLGERDDAQFAHQVAIKILSHAVSSRRRSHAPCGRGAAEIRDGNLITGQQNYIGMATAETVVQALGE